MKSDATIQVEVVFALTDRQTLLTVNIDPQSSCADAIRHSAIAADFPTFDLTTFPTAVWGRPVDPNSRVKDGDRVEILRPLVIDPRDARRQLAIEGQFMGGNSIDEPGEP